MRSDLGPEIMKDIFQFVQKPYNLRNGSTLQRPEMHIVLWNRKHIFSCPKNMRNSTYLYGAFDCMLVSCHVCVSE